MVRAIMHRPLATRARIRILKALGFSQRSVRGTLCATLRLKSGFDLDDEVDFDGDVEWEGGDAEGGAGVFAFFAEEFDE